MIPRSNIKTLCDIAPAAVFFLLYALRIPYNYGGIVYEPLYVATAAMVVVTLLCSVVSWVILRKIPLLPVIMLIPVVVFGGLTLWLHDETFIKIKPTIMNGLWAVLLFGSVLIKKPAVRILFGEMVNFSAEDARTLTLRWGMFFMVLAIANEITRHTLTTDLWVWWKTFGALLLGVPFMLMQWPILVRAVEQQQAAQPSPSPTQE